MFPDYAGTLVIKTVVRIFKRKITQSIKRNKQFFKKYYDQIYIVSGGFKECIVPVVEPFSIASNHILANTFKFNETGQITGYDKNKSSWNHICNW